MWAWSLANMGVVPYLVRVPGRYVHQHGAWRGVPADGDVGVVPGEDGRGALPRQGPWPPCAPAWCLSWCPRGR